MTKKLNFVCLRPAEIDSLALRLGEWSIRGLASLWASWQQFHPDGAAVSKTAKSAFLVYESQR